MMLRRDQRGSAVVELTILTPAMLIVLMFVVATGRIAQASNDVYGAAADAARAASMRQHAVGAEADARATAARSLSDRGVTCHGLRVGVDASRLGPGGTVTVAVTCTVGLHDLGLLGLPGSRSVSATAHEIVDSYRGT
ncbi:MAG TPA: TadE family protein [Acidimicrobiia bacterium]|nr:TadE family protein [Acidimicrobiia bacterium]